MAHRLESLWDTRAYGRRLLWWLLPDADVLKNRSFQLLLASRFLAETGQQALSYGILVAVVREGGGTFESALVAVAASIPPAALGLIGGTVADSLPKRIALILGYVGQAIACLLMPLFFGAELAALLALLFAVSALGQLSGPSEQSIVPLVVDQHQLATANSFKDLSVSAGQAVGTALLAPIVIKLFGVEPITYVAGALLLLAAIRLFAVQSVRGRQKVDFKPPTLSTITAVIPWLVEHRAVAAMLVLSVLAGIANLVVTTLSPSYVQTVLDADPADAVYVFAPAAGGLFISMSFVPKMASRSGERKAAVLGFAIAAAALFGLGLVGTVADVIDPYNPLRELGDWAPSRKVRTAAALTLPLGFGLTTVTASVHTYLNKYVPEVMQGRVFALQSSLKNGVGIVPLLSLGALGTLVGVDTVLLFAPVFMLLMALVFAAESYRWALDGLEPMARLREIPISQWLLGRRPEETSVDP
ncbi:MAG: MFS transporter [Dehalococcoidia bacterium]